MEKLSIFLAVMALLCSLAACTPEEQPTDSRASNSVSNTPIESTPADSEPADHDHNYTEQVTEPTCEEKGFTTFICDCGESYTDNEAEALGHTWEEWLIVQVGDCTQDEVTKRTCSVCQITEDQIVAATGWHNYTNEGVCFGCGKIASIGLAYHKIQENNEYFYSVIGIGSCKDTEINIPNVYNGLPVAAIDNWAFHNQLQIISVSIPDSVNRIGTAAFNGCKSLTNIVIPKSVTRIGDEAFKFCSSLTSITIPQNVTSIGFGVFSFCSSLNSIQVNPENPIYCSTGNCLIESTTGALIAGCNVSVIPDDGSVTSIVNSAFSGCSSLTNITIPESVISIGAGAFSGCSNLIQKEGGIHYVDCWAINSDNSVITVTLRDDIVGIGESAFFEHKSLTDITIPDSVTSIGDYAFSGCSSLSSVTLPEKVGSIGEGAFYGCNSLTSIIIPESVTSIGDYAFTNCSSLTSITLPDGVTSIGIRAFQRCSNISIYYGGTKARWNTIEKGSNWDYDIGNYTIYCTDGEITI